MSKELVIATGIPYSGRTTWINKKYCSEGTVIIEEDKFEGMMKDGKVQESVFLDSNAWITTQVKQLMESETPCARIVVSYLQSRPDHWKEVLELAVAQGYSLTLEYPKNGYLYYASNKFGRNQEQIEWVKKATVGRFPKPSKDKKKEKKADEEEIKENPNLYENIVTEYMSAYAFILQHKTECGTDPKKWLGHIESNYKAVIIRTVQERKQRADNAAKQAAIKAKEEAMKAALEAKKAKLVEKEATKEETQTQVAVATA